MVLPYSEKVFLLGYPIDQRSKGALEQNLLTLIESYFKDQKTRYATSVTALFLGQLSGFNLNHQLIPQITDPLKNADFIGINSKELQLLAQLLGNPIESRVTPEDLLLATASLLAKHKQSLFLLGAKVEICEQVKEALIIDFPGLKVVKCAAPEIRGVGIGLEKALEVDKLIIEMINEAKPTVLALHLGHPKQEIWFDRIRSSLNVPLVIGIGGAFEAYLGRKAFFQENGGGFSFKLAKFKKNAISVLRYMVWLPPLLIYSSVNRFLYKFLYKRYKKSISGPRLFLAEKESLFVVPLPPFINQDAWNHYPNWIEEALEHQNIIMDFSAVSDINLMGLSLLHAIFKRIKLQNKNLFLIGMTGDIKLLLKLHGAWEAFMFFITLGPRDVLVKTSRNLTPSEIQNREFFSISQYENQTTLSFFGKIKGNDFDSPNPRFSLDPLIVGRDLIVDLSYCSDITSKGFVFLMHLRDLQAKRRQTLTIAHANSFLKKQFKYFKLAPLFDFSK